MLTLANSSLTNTFLQISKTSKEFTHLLQLVGNASEMSVNLAVAKSSGRFTKDFTKYYARVFS